MKIDLKTQTSGQLVDALVELDKLLSLIHI